MEAIKNIVTETLDLLKRVIVLEGLEAAEIIHEQKAEYFYQAYNLECQIIGNLDKMSESEKAEYRILAAKFNPNAEK